MGNTNTAPTKRVFMQRHGPIGQPFYIKTRADVNVGQLLEELTTYLVATRGNDVGIGAQILIYNGSPLEESRRVSTLFLKTSSKYLNTRENPILFRDFRRVLWVKAIAADGRTTSTFPVPVNSLPSGSLSSVGQLKIAIEIIQQSTSNRTLYGNGVKDVFFAATAENVAPLSNYVCNLGDSSDDLPILFTERAVPEDFAGKVAVRVVALYLDLTSRSKSTSSERATAAVGAVVKATAGGV